MKTAVIVKVHWKAEKNTNGIDRGGGAWPKKNGRERPENKTRGVKRVIKEAPRGLEWRAYQTFIQVQCLFLNIFSIKYEFKQSQNLLDTLLYAIFHGLKLRRSPLRWLKKLLQKLCNTHKVSLLFKCDEQVVWSRRTVSVLQYWFLTSTTPPPPNITIYIEMLALAVCFITVKPKPCSSPPVALNLRSFILVLQ